MMKTELVLTLALALLAPAAHADTSSAGITPAAATATAPATYKVKFETTKGDFVVGVHRDWAPLGAQSR